MINKYKYSKPQILNILIINLKKLFLLEFQQIISILSIYYTYKREIYIYIYLYINLIILLVIYVIFIHFINNVNMVDYHTKENDVHTYLSTRIKVDL